MAIGVTQPTLSAGIAEFERQIGSALFIRERRAIRLTSAGNRLLSLARAIDRDFRLIETTDHYASTPQRPFRLGLLQTLSTRMIEGIVCTFRLEQPLIVVEGPDRDLREKLLSRKIDAAITLARAGDNQETTVMIYEEDYRMMLPESHRFADRALLEASELAEEVMIVRRHCEILPETSRFFTERGVRPLFSFRSVNDDRCMSMVAAGLGITTAPTSLARPGVIAVPLSGYDFCRTICLLHPRNPLISSSIYESLREACEIVMA